MERVKHLLNNASFVVKNKVFYHTSFAGEKTFEDTYVSLRKKENRVYSEDVIKALPIVEQGHPLTKEWKIRQRSAHRLIEYFKHKQKVNPILEIGCGNGWLSHQLAISLHAEVCALDINETELLQGANVFSDCENLLFICGDIFSPIFDDIHFNSIILAGTIPYFEDLELLIARLLELLYPSGEIHILDSPMYTRQQIDSAKKRSAKHFQRLEHPAMVHYYHHHLWSSLKNFNHKIIYNPHSLWNKVKKSFTENSPFPWICITH